jgi:hypothetical protein
MTLGQWKIELADALEGTGWVAAFPGMSQDASSIWAKLHDTHSTQSRELLLQVEQHMTVESRRTEIRRAIAK